MYFSRYLFLVMCIFIHNLWQLCKLPLHEITKQYHSYRYTLRIYTNRNLGVNAFDTSEIQFGWTRNWEYNEYPFTHSLT